MYTKGKELRNKLRNAAGVLLATELLAKQYGIQSNIILLMNNGRLNKYLYILPKTASEFRMRQYMHGLEKTNGIEESCTNIGAQTKTPEKICRCRKVMYNQQNEYS